MLRLINKLKNRKGFTLIELIVVLAVLAVIMAIAVPRFLGVQESAEEKADENTLLMIAKAAELYYVQTGKTGTPTTSLADIDDFVGDDISFKSTKYTTLNVTASSIDIEFNDDGSVEEIEGFDIDDLK